VILAGGGVTTSNAFQELLQLAELLMSPVATTFMGKGSFPENHPLSIGNIGMHGSAVANKLILEADVLLVHSPDAELAFMQAGRDRAAHHTFSEVPP
jgi:acetolactate synthase-1/2/3 large subunit